MSPECCKELNDNNNRVCDFCSEKRALVYCMADSAKLCLECDTSVHATNPLFKKHNRSLLCDICDSKPSSIHCVTHQLVLCQNCDFDCHDGEYDGGCHDRRPVEGFNGCPTAVEMGCLLGFDDGVDGEGGGGEDDGLLVWKMPCVKLNVEGLIGWNEGNQGFQAMGIPPLPKNRNTVCGKYKEEVVIQLRDMMRSDPSLKSDLKVDSLGFQLGKTMQPENSALKTSVTFEPFILPSYELSNFQWQDNFAEAVDQFSLNSTLLENSDNGMFLVPNQANSAGHLDVQQAPLPLVPKVIYHELNSQERDSAITRYKEKKKNRRYDKHIRYETRKARAETRTRIKGRFAKVD